MPILRIKKRPVTVEEMKPKRPVPPPEMVEAAMRAIPIAWQEIGEKTMYSLLKKLQRMGHSRFAAEWALFRHVEQGHITIEVESRHYRNEICDQETGDPTGIFNEGDIEEYHLKATNRLWKWWREESERRNNPPPATNPKQAEGNGGAGSIPEQPVPDPDANKKKILEGLQPADRKAYWAFHYVATRLERRPDRLQDREAYDWLKEHGIDANKGDVGELADYELPAFDTWAKQLRNARNPLGEQKYTRRAGRAAGRSIVSGREIEQQRTDDR